MKRYLQKSNQYHNIIKNFFFLIMLQGSNFLIVLILYPYLSVTLKVEKFGLVVLGQSIMSFFLILADYGFNLQSTQKITIHKHNLPEISRIHSQTLWAKFFLLFIGLGIWIFIVLLIPTFRSFAWFYLLSYVFVIGQTFIPIWFFQGIEQFQYISYLNVSGKVLSLICIFLMVKTPADYILVNPILGIGNLFIAIFAIFFIQKRFQLSWYKCSLQELKILIKQGSGIFFSNIAINIYMNSNIVILKFITQNDLIVGYYGIADKIVSFMKQLIVIAAQAVYPSICQLSQNISALKKFLKSIFKIFTIGTFVFCTIIFVFAKEVVFLFSKSEATEPIYLLKIICFSPMLIAMNNPAYQALIVFNYQKSYTLILVTASLLCVLLNVILSWFFGAYGTAWSVLSTEVFVMLGLNIILHYKYSNIRFLSK